MVIAVLKLYVLIRKVEFKIREVKTIRIFLHTVLAFGSAIVFYLKLSYAYDNYGMVGNTARVS